MTRGLPFLSLLLAFCLAPSTVQDPAPLEVGRPAPALDVEWLDGKAPLELGRGRAAVLVFWAPWCRACLAEFPRLNELVDELAGEPLDFVALADDPRESVTAMLAERPLATRQALDRDGRTFAAYEVIVRPRLVLVDPAGQVAALPRLEDVTSAHLRALAAGEALDLPRARSRPCDLEWDRARAPLDAERSLGHAWIERSDAASGGLFFPPEHGSLTTDGTSLSALLQVAYEAEPFQLENRLPAALEAERYRVSVKAPDDAPATARAMLAELLARLVPHRAEWVTREQPTLVLRRDERRPLTHLVPSRAAQMDGFARRGSMRYTKVPFTRFLASLRSLGFDGELVDETGLVGEFDVELDWTPGKPGALEAALVECGFEVLREPRPVRKLVVTPR